MKPTPEQFDRARREWLDGIRVRHAATGSAESALALARAEWLCGEHAAAMARFIEARDLAPEQEKNHLALIFAAGMLGRRAEAGAALDLALARHPRSPALAVHACRHRLALGPPQALAAVERHRDADPLCAAHCAALDALIGGEAPAARAFGDPRLDAAWDGFRWLHAQAPAAGVLGLPTDVLVLALERAAVPGLIAECGVYFGRSLTLIAERAGQLVHGFDSFQGLPEAWKEGEPTGAYSTGGRQPSVPSNVRLHAGWFEDTLPAFFARESGPLRLLHVDCDLYSSTRTVLQASAERLVPGTVLVFDDFIGYPGAEAHEFRAFHEFARERGLHWSVLGGALLAREVCIRIQ